MRSDRGQDDEYPDTSRTFSRSRLQAENAATSQRRSCQYSMNAPQDLGSIDRDLKSGLRFDQKLLE